MIRAVLLTIMLYSGNALAADVWVYNATVTKIVASDFYGTCSVRLSAGSGLAGCTYDDVVLFDCDGTYQGDKRKAANKLATAQLAHVTGQTVDVWITNAYVANGVCFAKFIQTPGTTP